MNLFNDIYYKNTNLLGILIIIIIIIIIVWYKNYYKVSIDNTSKLCVDNESCYGVHNLYNDPKNAASLIHSIDTKNRKLMNHLRNKYLTPARPIDNKTRLIERLNKNYNPDNIVEMSPDNTDGHTSYVENKGDVIAYCLRHKSTDKLHDEDHIMFVNLHEISHLADKNIGHEKTFWSIFKFILHEAEEAGIYKPVQYRDHPFDYCNGLYVDYNPYYDNSLQPV